MTYVPAEVARNIRIVTGNNIRHKCGSGPESGDFGPFLFCTLNLNNKKKEKVIRNRKM